MIKYLFFKLLKKIRLIGIKNSYVHRTSKIESGTTFISSSMDKYSFCGYDCDIVHTIIGSFCSIANNVKIGGGKHPIDWVSTSPVFYKGRDSVRKKFSKHERDNVIKTHIGNDVWIGEGCIIKQGIKIGNGSVIGMGSVVTKDVEPYSIVGGVPARVLRFRFSNDLISKLMKSEWWNLDDNILSEASSYIQNPDLFLECLKNKSVSISEK